jgi:hypothetical protein
MVKTILASDLEAQQISRLNEHILVADRIRKASWSAPMSKLVKHSRVSKQPGETMMVNNSSPINERMKGKRTTWNVSNSGTLASNGQGSGLLRNKLLIPNGSGGALVLSPSLNLGGLALIAWSASLLAQNDRVIRPMTSGLSTKSSFLKDLQHENNAPADSTTFGGFVLRL